MEREVHGLTQRKEKKEMTQKVISFCASFYSPQNPKGELVSFRNQSFVPFLLCGTSFELGAT
jgi:hypothetical protein